MEFTQTKLTRYEWESMEQAVDAKELEILKMIYNGFYNTEIDCRLFSTINQILKLDHPDKDYHIYVSFFKKSVDSLVKKYEYKKVEVIVPKKPLNSADKIRLSSSHKNVDESVESLILTLITKFGKTSRSRELYYYNVQYLSTIYTLNSIIQSFVTDFLSMFESSMNINTFITNTHKYIENNDIFRFKPLGLYAHQKDIYNMMNTDGPKLICYRAPTSSGKTLTPIGISKKFRVIFMCASRHIGLSLAKSAVNVGVKVGFSFGCTTSDDVRLHYSSIRTFTEKFGKKRPVHSDGRNVELMICDIQSYEVAMLYMESFFDSKQIVLFWDEPTISMDYDSHPLHEHITHIWKINKVSTIILSSATLPNESELQPLFEKYKSQHAGSIHYLESLDETTNITLLDSNGSIVMPHTVFTDSEGMHSFITDYGKSHMKFLSLEECASFIMFFAEKHDFIMKELHREFPTLKSITSQSLRMFYYKVNELLPEWFNNVTTFTKTRTKKLNVGNLVVTESSHTLTHGPTIYLCENPNTWIDYFVSNSGILQSTMVDIEKKIQFNNDVAEKMSKVRKLIEDKTAKDEENENKMKDQRFDAATKTLISELETLERSIKKIQFNHVYIPNTREHFSKWTSDLDYDKVCPFISDVDDSYVKKIMKLEVDMNYKILILLGVGIFNPNSGDYNDIMKELSEQKKLGVIIAGSDYIYGTNYQFSHAYIAEDLMKMTREKIIQSIGRVGRKEQNKTFTFRFRENELIPKLFMKGNSLESDNMNKLFM